MNWPMISTVVVVIASISIVLWVFRPNSKKLYDQASQIPLKDDERKK